MRHQIFSIKNSQSQYLVAVWQDSIVSFSDFGLSRATTKVKGEIYFLYLLQAYKKREIGTELIKHIRTHFTQTNLRPFMVWVLEENIVACQFYENQGSVQCDRKMVKRGNKSYSEICYKFDLLYSL